MSNTITIDNVPDGYELTGEYRRPNKGEWFLHDFEAYKAESCDMYYARLILRKLEPPKAPKGYELTGEYREPKEGESWIDPCGLACNNFRVNYLPGMGVDTCRWILRKVWQAPAWMPKGAWLFKSASDDWYFTDSKPKPHPSVTDRYFGNLFLPAAGLARLHGETFTPPTHTTCVQIWCR